MKPGADKLDSKQRVRDTRETERKKKNLINVLGESKKQKSLFFFSQLERDARNWKRGNTKTRALRAFIFLVYRPRGALDNVRFPPMEMTSIRQTSGWRGCARDMCAEARVQMKRRFRTAGTKASCVRWASRKKKKERKKKGEGRGQLRANRRQFEPLNRNAWKKIPIELLSFLSVRY